MLILRSLLFIIPLISSCTTTITETSPNLGKPPSIKLIKLWNIDIFPNGEGLPQGYGSVSLGKKVYNKHCVSCHGVDGSGHSAEELAGADHSLTDHPPDKTIGTYWPYATTLFDFTRRAMPLNTPGILNNNEVYSVTAYLLYLNKIIDKKSILTAKSLPKVKMPNRNGFINIYQEEKN